MNIQEMIELGKQGRFDELEEQRERMYQELMDNVTNEETKRKLAGLHFQVKNIRYKYKNPLVAAIKVNELMMQSLGELNQSLSQFRGLDHDSIIRGDTEA